MNTVFILDVQSWIDVITNSSSEIYSIQTYKRHDRFAISKIIYAYLDSIIDKSEFKKLYTELSNNTTKASELFDIYILNRYVCVTYYEKKYGKQDVSYKNIIAHLTNEDLLEIQSDSTSYDDKEFIVVKLKDGKKDLPGIDLNALSIMLSELTIALLIETDE